MSYTLPRRGLRLAVASTAAVVPALLVGYVAGASGATARTAERAETGPCRRCAERPASESAPVRVARPAHPEGHPHGDPADLPAPEAVGPDDVATEEPLDLQPLFDAARAARDLPDDHEAQEVARMAADDLRERLLADPHAVTSALGALRSLRDPEELLLVAALLAQVRDPEVEAAALELARHDPDPARRVAAFDILDGLDTPQARELAVSALAQEARPDVRLAALRAIPEPAGASRTEAEEVAGSLVRVLASDADPEARRRAAVLLGRWHTRPAELDRVVEALHADPDPNVRAGAAFAFEVAGRRDPAVVEALVASLTREGEDPLVRENAWHALAALSPLPAPAQAAYRAFEAELVALNEAREE